MGEPTAEHGLHWYENPQARRAHREAVRRSLEAFLNEHLAQLYFMLRTGWWVLGKVRVRVVECRPVPEREMRQLTRAIRRATSWGGLYCAAVAGVNGTGMRADQAPR